MPPQTLIRDATVVLPREEACTNVLLEGGRIAGIDPPRHARADEIVDAAGLHLLPGVIDDQVHFRDPGLTHKEDLRTGSRACAAAGVTSFLEMPNTVPQTVTVDALGEKLALAARRCVVNYGFYMGATTDNLAELQRAERTPGASTPGIKIFIGSSTGDMLVDDQERLEEIFAGTTLPITAHCEDESTVRANRARLQPPLTVHDHSRIRDHRAAVTATLRAIDLAVRHRHRFHVLHVSTAEEVGILAAQKGLITAEACPHHLFLDTSAYDRLGTLAQMNPSLKTAADRAALWRGLRNGAIQIIATDHPRADCDPPTAGFPRAGPSVGGRICVRTGGRKCQWARRPAVLSRLIRRHRPGAPCVEPRSPDPLRNGALGRGTSRRVWRHRAPGRNSAPHPGFRPVAAGTGPVFRRPDARSTADKRRRSARIAGGWPNGVW